MRRIIGITSLLFLLTSLWVFFVEFPKILFSPLAGEYDFSVMVFVFPFGLFVLGLTGLYKAIRNKKKKTGYRGVLTVQIIYVALILILGRLV